MPPNLNVLLIGAGAREHALAAAIARSPLLGTLHVSHPQNPGLAALGRAVDVPVSAKEFYRLKQYADRHDIGLVVIGPEQPLAEGFADALAVRADGSARPIFGPSAAAARIESDKAYAKQIMRAASIPTAEGRVFDRAESAADYLKTRDEAQVIKASGLAAGKGVIVPETLEDGLAAIDDIMVKRSFGSAGSKLIIEERLQGPEVSVLALCDGHNILTLPPCQDHKRLKDHDAGPNTGGMGAFCPSATLDDDTLREVEREILVPAIDAMRRDEVEFRGVLYAGLMLTPAGPKVLEFNARFGDPECQPLLARLQSDALELLLATATGRLDEVDVRFDERPAVTVVLASAGYPQAPRAGDEITGIDEAEALEDVSVHFAGVRAEGDRLLTAGGRVLSITALGDTLAHARERAYAAVDRIHFEGMQFRRDIGSAPVPARR